MEEVKQYFFDLDFEKSDSSLQKISDQSQNAYLNIYQSFIQNIVAHSISFDEYASVFNHDIDLLKENNYSKLYNLYLLSELYLQRGIIEYQNEHSFRAISYFTKAYSYWKDCEGADVGNHYNLKLSGIFNLLIGNLPNPYSQMAGWVGFSGDTKKGFVDLEKYLQLQSDHHGDYMEALIYLGFSYLKFAKDESQIEKFIQNNSSTDLPELIQSLMLRCANKIHQPLLCLNILKSKSDFPILIYLQGKYMVQSLSDTAEPILKQFLKLEKSNQFKADAFRYLSWHYLLNGDTIRYQQYQDSILVMDDYPTSEDKQAKFENDLNVIPDLSLLKARLLFDKGAYEIASTVLLSVRENINSTENLIEYHYRLGRCFQYLNNENKALYHFKACVDLGKDSKRYFAPYSALYATKIFLHQKSISDAKLYFQKAEELNNGEYNYSIKQELAELKNLCWGEGE
ncbi:hypothetical protein [Plebeiibacterium sediminum]|uniref:Tetratricopeptide repeat protein n=1 Tax=Plebeiibacterium sediminum TaxID=2992112 RepID=A0AAE3M813_9BACT|nr:hypothetical protein [Plebeiobacterium sediminum]MCW3788260.1 hypothetical protein [Plebeiobacterium sediminum]